MQARSWHEPQAMGDRVRPFHTNSILPTNDQLHRQDLSQHGCPASNHQDKEWSHNILQCSNSSRAEWRASMLASLSTTICNKWNTRPRIRDILLDGLRLWLLSTIAMQQVECTTTNKSHPPWPQRMVLEQPSRYGYIPTREVTPRR